jgi:hypothetical protein
MGRGSYVREGCTRSDWTLAHTRKAIVPLSIFLEESMPVQRSAFFNIGDVVVHSYLGRKSSVGGTDLT